MQRTIDLNADVGEGVCDSEGALMDLVTSVNIACGFHAGDPRTIRRTVQLALEKGCAIGAHPSFADREGFGRRDQPLPAEEVYELVLYQIGALAALTQAAGGTMTHVKPHGALYNRAAKDAQVADAIARATADFDSRLFLLGPPGSELLRAAADAGLRGVAEAFVDRRYERDGTLTPRTLSGAVLQPHETVAQTIGIARHHSVISRTGETVPVIADTLCIHGDCPDALATARRVRQALTDAGIIVSPFSDTRTAI